MPDSNLTPAIGHSDLANAIRVLSMDAVEKANSGHPGMPMGKADVATVLFQQFLRFDPSRPRWLNRDRLILSAGHGSMLLYSLAYLTGYGDVSLDEIKNFRQMGAKTAGHPEHGYVDLAETTTGPLGQGLANAVGFALAEAMLAEEFGSELVNHRTYVIAGDGCLMEGLSQEAITLAGHWRLNKLVVLWDDNQICIDGPVSLVSSEDQHARFQAAGWATCSVDGHDPVAVAKALTAAQSSSRPTLIACRTVIGKGAPTKAGTSKVHGSPLGADEVAGTRQSLGWKAPAFEIPAPILEAWRAIGRQHQDTSAAWEGKIQALPAAQRDALLARWTNTLGDSWKAGLNALKQKLATEKPSVATRKSSQTVLEVLTAAVPAMVGGSADLTGSVLTMTKACQKPIGPGSYDGRYIHYGVREHAMAAIMNGMALHGGFLPYGGTFLIFANYLWPALRMSAMMKLRVLYILTHDSIGLGEDGPTHQPVETLAALRATPGVLVFRPCDGIETAEAYEVALQTQGPSVFALSRQNLPTLREFSAENRTTRGGYVLSEAKGERKVTLIATGSEVQLALQAQQMLADKGVPAAVVSLPCWELFDQQTLAYRDEVLGRHAIRVAIEAQGTFGWERYVGIKGAIIGMNGFGASAPADELYAHFGITAEAMVQAALERM